MEIKDSLKVYCECELYEDTEGNHGIMPVYSTEDAACADVALPKQLVIPNHTAVKEDLLIGFRIPKGYKIVMYPRSSLLIKKNLIQPTSIIDADYSGMHIHVPLFNPTDEDIVLERGERVAQIECVPRYDSVSWLRRDTKREGGFGSTGK